MKRCAWCCSDSLSLEYHDPECWKYEADKKLSDYIIIE